MKSREQGANVEHRSLRAQRFVKVATMVLGLFALAAHSRDGAAATREYSDIDQLSGKNFEEREKEIKKLQDECDEIKKVIDKLEARIADVGSDRYMSGKASRGEERMELFEEEGKLRRKEAAIGRLQKGMDAGHERTEREIERQENRTERLDRAGLEKLEKSLDLSAEHLGNKDIAEYYTEYQVGFENHTLFFQLHGVDPYERRGSLRVGREFTDAHFFIEKRGTVLKVVLRRAHGGYSTLLLEKGELSKKHGGFYDSDETGESTSDSD